MREILGFRRFTTPLVIAILFGLGLISLVIAVFAIVFQGEHELPLSLGTRIGIAIAWIFFASLFGGSFVRCPWSFSEATRRSRKSGKP
jgi:predicted PurR-regulated permease PerM